MALKKFQVLFIQSVPGTQGCITWANAKNFQIHLFSHRKWCITLSSALHTVFTSTKTNPRNLQKQFNALYHMPLVTTTNVIFCGVATNKIPLNTPTINYPMERICMGAAFNRLARSFFWVCFPNSGLKISPLLRLSAKQVFEWNHWLQQP